MANYITHKKRYVQQFLRFADTDGKYPSDCEYKFNRSLLANGKYQEMDSCCKNSRQHNITRKAKRCADGKSESYKAGYARERFSSIFFTFRQIFKQMRALLPNINQQTVIYNRHVYLQSLLKNAQDIQEIQGFSKDFEGFHRIS
ncbi:uncharacterized protein LOC117177177 isoform X2 [Belonocnema kinseyi]|nr:uncharacterized protein LOC117177177 isoform X2 [Belonocnema kinseyi]